MISLHHLHAFSAIAAKREVRHSTNMLSRRYAPTVRSAAELEKSLNIQLFECNRHGIMLTAAGEAVCLHARSIESELREIQNEAMDIGPLNVRPARGMKVLFDHRCIRIVCMLADGHYMPKVAHSLGMSHSAASQMIANLENVLGHALFLHTAHGMVLSKIGIRWIARFSRILAKLTNIESDIAALKCVVEA